MVKLNHERRYVPRIRGNEISIRIRPFPKGSLEKSILHGTAIDIGEMGILCELNSSLPSNTKNFTVFLNLPNNNSEIRINGLIAWKNDNKHRYGIQFTDYSDEQLSQIQTFISNSNRLEPDRRGISRRNLDEQIFKKSSRIDFLIKNIRKQLESRVVVTGIGIISPLGNDKKSNIEKLKEGATGVKVIDSFDASKYPTNLGGTVTNYHPEDTIPYKKIKLLDRSTQFAISATTQAIEDSKIKIGKHLHSTEVGVYIGTTTSGHYDYYKQLELFMKKGPDFISPFAVISCFPDACSGQVSIHFRIRGPSVTVNTGCASGTSAVTQAYDQIKKGTIKAAIAGGTDAPVFEPLFAGFCRGKVLSPSTDYPIATPKPFDKERDGIVLSEGAAVLILEDLEFALGRGANIYGEIAGYGSTCDAYRMIGPEPSGRERERAIRLALQNSNLTIKDIDYINAHGTGTLTNDKIETNIIKRIFSDRAYKVPISSTKSLIGHTQGACGAIEIATCLFAMNENFLPPTINYSTPDPECDLDYIPNKARLNTRINSCISNSFAFGGKNETIALVRF